MVVEGVMNEMEWSKLWGLFHHAWGQAKESPEYNKKIFTEIQIILQSLENSDKKKIVIQDRRKNDRRKEAK
jgi:hypothetical protein